MNPYHVMTFAHTTRTNANVVGHNAQGRNWPEVEKWLTSEADDGYEFHSVTTVVGADGRIYATVITREHTETEEDF